jgi:hypothetical protein
VTKREDLRFAANAWVEMFGATLPVSEDQLADELFHQASEPANVVTMAIRRHSYQDFRAELEALIAQNKGKSK